MKRATKKSMLAGFAALAMLGGTVAGVAIAQRDPAYQAARSQGLIGEKPDGYLGIVGSPTAQLQALVDDLNIKRKAAYTSQAAANNSTVEQFAFTSGCNLIMKTVAGEKYMAPDGSWNTRGTGEPERDPRCP